MQTKARKVYEHNLSLAEILDMLVADAMVPTEEATKLKASSRMRMGELHPLVVVADQKWKSAQPPHKLMHLDMLTEWLAQKVGLPYFHIDPLKIDFAAVTNVMSNVYASRFKILPLEVTSREVVIATAEPYITDWENQLGQVLRRDIRRVIANPLDITQYIAEFYNLARSIKGAAKSSAGASGLSNLSNWSTWDAAASRSMPMTSILSASWTGYGSTPSNSVQATFT